MNYQKWDLHLWPKKGCEDFTRFVLYYNWSWIGNKHTLYLAVLTNHASSLECSLKGSGTLVIQLHCDDKHSKLPSLTIMPFFLPFFGDQRRMITSQPSMLTLKYFRARTLDCTKDHKWPAGRTHNLNNQCFHSLFKENSLASKYNAFRDQFFNHA